MRLLPTIPAAWLTPLQLAQQRAFLATYPQLASSTPAPRLSWWERLGNPYEWIADRIVHNVPDSWVEAWAGPSVRSEPPSFWVSLIPIYGSINQADYHLSRGEYGWTVAYTLLAASDVFLVRSILTSLGRVGWRIVIRPGGETTTEVASREIAAAASAGGSGTGGLSMPNVPWRYARLPDNLLGVTDLRTGKILIQEGLTGTPLIETVRHEAIHYWLTSIGGSTFRIEARIRGYENSHLLKYLEEAIAEIYATGSLRHGLAYPLNGSYNLSVKRIIFEGSGYVIAVGGTSYGAYILGDSLLNR